MRVEEFRRDQKQGQRDFVGSPQTAFETEEGQYFEHECISANVEVAKTHKLLDELKAEYLGLGLAAIGGGRGSSGFLVGWGGYVGAWVAGGERVSA